MATTDEGDRVYRAPAARARVPRAPTLSLKLAGTAANYHTLVCLPAGLGKTTVSLLVTARRLEEVGGKSLMLAPTKPLVQQHADFYRSAPDTG